MAAGLGLAMQKVGILSEMVAVVEEADMMMITKARVAECVQGRAVVINEFYEQKSNPLLLQTTCQALEYVALVWPFSKKMMVTGS